GIGLGGKGLGKGGCRRHRKILRSQEPPCVTNPVWRRLARKGGVKRMSGMIYGEARNVLKMYLEQLIKETVIYTEHAGRSTVTVMDVVYALKRSGRTLYGFGI
ncbi:hypothetical protein DL96DRAFT_1459171, partial [Flagelloscypha sp. PMI_526]